MNVLLVFLLIFPLCLNGKNHLRHFASESFNKSYVEILEDIRVNEQLASSIYITEGKKRALKYQLVLVDTAQAFESINLPQSRIATKPEQPPFLVVLPVNISSSRKNEEKKFPSQHSLKSITSIYHTILQHARDPSSPIYSLLASETKLDSSTNDINKSKTNESIQENQFFSQYVKSRTAISSSSTSSQTKYGLSSQPLSSLPEFVVFGSVVSASHRVEEKKPPIITAHSVFRLIRHLESILSSENSEELNKIDLESASCDMIPITSSPSDTAPISLSMSLKQVLGQRGIKAWLGLLKAMERTSTETMTQSLNLPVLPHSYQPKHPYYINYYESDSLSKLPENDNNVRHFQNYPYLFPISDALVTFEPFQLYILRPRLLVPLAEFMVHAENVLETENKWNIQALFFQSEAMKIHIFQRLPMLFLSHLMVPQLHVCRQFHPYSNHHSTPISIMSFT